MASLTQPRPAKDVKDLQPDDPKYIESLRKRFPFQGYISEPEQRGVTLRQLRKSTDYATRHCIEWYDLTQKGQSKTNGVQLSVDVLNTYHLRDWLLKPACSQDQCAAVELFARGKQPPDWFICHWWGEPLNDFMMSLEKHVQVRGETIDVAYWAWGYAHRLHLSEDSVCADISQTTCFKAMCRAKGMLLMLDAAGPATPFKRIWCAFEEAVMLVRESDGKSMLLDIATTSGKDMKRSELLTDGTTATDDDGKSRVGGPEQVKAKREANFPLQVIKEGLRLELEKADATNEDDRVCILNCLAGMDLKMRPPPQSHENYTKFNKKLRARLAVLTWRHALESKGGSAVRELGLAEDLAADVWRETLNLDLSFTKMESTDLTDIAHALPNTLRNLNLDFRRCVRLGSSGLRDLADMLPASLLSFRLICTGCRKIDNSGVVCLAKKLPPTLQLLDLNFYACHAVNNISVAEIALRMPSSLQTLELNFSWCEQISNASVAVLLSRLPTNLQKLALHFRKTAVADEICDAMGDLNPYDGADDNGCLTPDHVLSLSEDAVGNYIVVRESARIMAEDFLDRGGGDGAKMIMDLSIGGTIEIGEIRCQPKSLKVWGRTVDPPGWALLLDTINNLRFAVPEKPDGPGMYLVLRDRTGVGVEADRVGDGSGRLNKGQQVKALQVKDSLKTKKIRAQIEKPRGWITLVNKENGQRGAAAMPDTEKLSAAVAARQKAQTGETFNTVLTRLLTTLQKELGDLDNVVLELQSQKEMEVDSKTTKEVQEKERKRVMKQKTEDRNRTASKGKRKSNRRRTVNKDGEALTPKSPGAFTDEEDADSIPMSMTKSGTNDTEESGKETTTPPTSNQGRTVHKMKTFKTDPVNALQAESGFVIEEPPPPPPLPHPDADRDNMPYEPNYLKALNGKFPFQGFIADTAHRGVSLRQLRRVIEFVAKHGTNWCALPWDRFHTEGTPLPLESLNLYQLNDWFIKPACYRQNCAFVELVSQRGKQTPNWFVSHWWGEPILDFVLCVDKHVQTRAESLDVAYWVCAYANRQHRLTEDLNADPRQTSFFRAMQLTKGVLLVLDVIGPATPFKRVWCAFEEAVLMLEGDDQIILEDDRNMGVLLDIVTTVGKDNKRAEIITDGITATDDDGFHRVGGPEQAKAQRESTFPIQIVKEGLKLELEKSTATNDEDRVHILNCLAGRDVHLRPPLETHENYTKINQRLRAIFGVAAWRQAVDQKGGSIVRELGLSDVVASDVWRETLHLNFAFCKCVDSDLADIGKGLATSLKHLTLDFRRCQRFGDQGLTNLGEHFPASLQTLKLIFTGCRKISSQGIAVLSRAFPRGLEMLDLNFYACAMNDVCVSRLANALPTELSRLELNFSWCEQIHNQALAVLLSKLPDSLQKLKLHFRKTAVSEDVCDAITEFIDKPAQDEKEYDGQEVNNEHLLELAGDGPGKYTAIRDRTPLVTEEHFSGGRASGRWSARSVGSAAQQIGEFPFGKAFEVTNVRVDENLKIWGRVVEKQGPAWTLLMDVTRGIRWAAQEKVDVPSNYVILRDRTPVGFDPDRVGDGAGKLMKGAVVKVLQLKDIPKMKKIRGQIEKPWGWITLLDKASSSRVALRVPEVDKLSSAIAGYKSKKFKVPLKASLSRLLDMVLGKVGSLEDAEKEIDEQAMKEIQAATIQALQKEASGKRMTQKVLHHSASMPKAKSRTLKHHSSKAGTAGPSRANTETSSSGYSKGNNVGGCKKTKIRIQDVVHHIKDHDHIERDIDEKMMLDPDEEALGGHQNAQNAIAGRRASAVTAKPRLSQQDIVAHLKAIKEADVEIQQEAFYEVEVADGGLQEALEDIPEEFQASQPRKRSTVKDVMLHLQAIQEVDEELLEKALEVVREESDEDEDEDDDKDDKDVKVARFMTHESSATSSTILAAGGSPESSRWKENTSKPTFFSEDEEESPTSVKSSRSLADGAAAAASSGTSSRSMVDGAANDLPQSRKGGGLPSVIPSTDDAKAVKQYFIDADPTGTGVISKDRCVVLLRSIFPSWPQEEMDELLEEAPMTPDGLLNGEEFIDWLYGEEDEAAAAGLLDDFLNK